MSNPLTPIITFSVNLDRAGSENVGPVTNPNNTAVLHPDRHDNDQDRGYSNEVQHDANKSTFIPGFLTGENVVKNDDGTITAYGMKAKYLQDTYTTGDNPILSVVSIAYTPE